MESQIEVGLRSTLSFDVPSALLGNIGESLHYEEENGSAFSLQDMADTDTLEATGGDATKAEMVTTGRDEESAKTEGP